MMKRTRILTFLAGLTLLIVLSSAACSKDDKGINIPGPAASGSSSTGNGGTSGGGNNGGNTGGNGSTTDPVFTESLCTDLGQSPMVLAYYTENSKNLPDVTLLTHINYAHGRFKDPTNGDGGIEIDTPSLMQKVIALKSKNPKLKVMLMVGGWGMKADGFSKMAADATKRTTFCKSLKKHMDTYGLDGVDIDWEYPGVSAEGTGFDKLNDKKNFNLVLKELRETIGNTKIISFASSASHPEYVDWSVAAKYIDYVNVMTYDMGCAPTAHNSPLYSTSAVFNKQTGADKCIRKHVDAGIPKNRLVLGIPFYGKGYNGKKADQYPVADYQVYPYEVNYNQMADIFNKNTVTGRKYNQSNKETIDVTGKNIRKWDDVAKVPYLTDTQGRILLVYDDPESVAEKGKFAVKEGLLGAMFWEYRHDDDNQSLLKSLVQSMYGKNSVIQ